MNLPNKLSLTRLIITPIMMFFYLASFVPYGKFISAGLFIIGAITDFLDGYIARKYNLVTDMGKFLDPIADKLLVTSALILVATDGTIIAPFGAIALAIFVGRDLTIDMLRQIASAKGVVISANKLGKLKTATQDVAFSLLIVYSALKPILQSEMALSIVMWVAYSVLIIATILTIVSLINYLVKNKSVFSQAK
jgi:CDP-diacylglycerol--glycerol-3-phosphate 3-phosphatidyltransferase